MCVLGVNGDNMVSTFDYVHTCPHVLTCRCVCVDVNHRSTGDMDGCLPSSQFWTPTLGRVTSVYSLSSRHPVIIVGLPLFQTHMTCIM